jgi:hypothetical protein
MSRLSSLCISAAKPNHNSYESYNSTIINTVDCFNHINLSFLFLVETTYNIFTLFFSHLLGTQKQEKTI